MSFAIVVFAKTPHYSSFKTRLEVDIGFEETKRFYLHCLSKTKKKSLSCARQNGHVFYWAIAEAGAKHESIWSGENILVQEGQDLGQRLSSICDEVKSLGHQGYIFMGADCPHFDISELNLAFNYLSKGNKDSVALGPCQDGGFYFFASKIFLTKDFWKNIRLSSEYTTSDIIKKCIQLDIDVKLFAENYDIDNIHDYHKYIKEDCDYKI